MLTDASNRQSLHPKFQVIDLSGRTDKLTVSEYYKATACQSLDEFVKLSPNIKKPKLLQFENSH